MIITTKVSMDLQKPGFSPVIYTVQGDQNTRRLEMALYSGGTAFQVPEGTVVSMRYAKPDGKKGYYDTMPDGTTAASVNGNVISMLLVPQMLTVPGAVAAQLELLQGTMTLGTFSLIVHVEGDPAAGVVESEDYVNWVQWMEQEFQERVQALLKDGDLKGDPGPKGDPGENAALTGYSVAYQESESGEEEPTGEWLERIPSVEQGNYLWTRTVYTFNTGEPVTQYSVARFGIDGSGAVSSVAGISPDAAGNVALDASHVKALPIGGGDMEGPINMQGQALSGLNAPVEETDAANKQYVDENAGDITIDMEGAGEGEPNGINADTLGGQLPGYYATKEEVEQRISMKLLWENPNPKSAFEAQAVSVDFTGFDFYNIVYVSYATNAYYLNTGMIPVNENVRLSFLSKTVNNDISGGIRIFNSNNKTFGDGSFINNSNIDNLISVPCKIYGIKGVM